MVKPPKIYIESCPLIDLGKFKAKIPLQSDREKNVWYVRKMLEAARAGELEIFTSIITVSECTHVGQDAPIPNKDVQTFYDGLLTSGTSGIKLIQLTQTISNMSRDLRWKDGIRLSGFDSIHLATAIWMGCSELITTDGKLAKARIPNRNISLIQAKDTKVLLQKFMVDELSFE